ncbi:hypothetical protein FFLO_02770 [Filobasidium floriforme]|uniref:THUMP domain-containing protein n=1 Tax=Filobasidium floriforme TaxID=5210 RepID=A0A8K0NQY1_9TREE|nr:hypothetical protein FFLO_02770 [Filobasidium floriforme]
MPKADRTAVDKRRANYKKNSYTQAWAEGRYTKAKGKGKGRAADDDDEEEIKGVPLVYATSMRAPGVVVNCMRGKEKKCGIELMAVFNNIADELYPDTKLEDSDDESQPKKSGPPKTVEEELQAEIEGMKKEKEKKVYRFSFVQTKVECFVYIHMRKPLDPNRIVEHYLKSVETTGLTQSRFALRLIPCQSVTSLEVDKVVAACRDLIAGAAERVKAEKGPEHEWRLNYNSKTDSRIERDAVVSRAREMSDLKVTMKGADIVVGIEIYRGLAAIGTMTDFERFRRYNPQEISLAVNKGKKDESGRVIQAGKDGQIPTEPAAPVADVETAPAQPKEAAVPTSAPSEVTTTEA